MSNKTTTVFEHTTLHLDEDSGFEKSHFDSLVKFNDQYGTKYFNIGHNKVTFRSYVGVIQVADKVIEVLPKADAASDASAEKWRHALLHMLQIAGYIKLNATQKASLSMSEHHLMDMYLLLFLQETEDLIQRGMVRKYHVESSNEKALKGRLLIHKQIQLNMIHQERFYTEHTVYDTEHLLNRIIKAALEIISNINGNYNVKQQADKLLMHFDEITPWRGVISELDNITPGRQSIHYTNALELAIMVIRNYCPAFIAGNHHIIAFLFDMNRLFERFVYKSLKRQEPLFEEVELEINDSNYRNFWGNSSLKPDIILTYKDQTDAQQTIVIDAKWKIISADSPSEKDLKQMFTYNIQFGSTRSVLFYPRINQSNIGVRNYSHGDANINYKHGCELYFADLFDNTNSLSDNFSRVFIRKVVFGDNY